jgi:hypothetical protein
VACEIGNRHVMLTALLRREAQMTAHLTRDLLAVSAQRAGELTAREIARVTDHGGRSAAHQGAMTSSWTRSSRIAFGRSASSSS